MGLHDLLTKTQVNSIVQIVQEQCRKYRNCEREFSKCYYEPYGSNRKKHGLTYAIISGFIPDKTEISEMTIRKVEYGSYRQPELVGEKIVLNIYSNSNQLDSKFIWERCAKYNADMSTNPIFGCIIYEADEKYNLVRLTLKVLNRYAACVSEFLLYERPAITEVGISA